MMEAPPVYSRSHPFPGKMVVNRRFSEESAKETRHFEISLKDSGLAFEPGDSMAVYAANDPALVDELLKVLHLRGDEEVLAGKETALLRDALSRHYSITVPTPKFLKAITERADASPLLHELLTPERKGDLQQYLYGMEVIDFLLEHPSAHFDATEFVGLLTKLQPRLYSIANSRRAIPDSVHMIVDVIRYESHGRSRKGVASTFLADRSDAGVLVYPTAAKHFRLPPDEVDMIMVGPGTGIAPFRAFLQEREVRGASGRNWVFFGSQRESCDYFYQDDFDRMRASGILTRIDCAFSRDQDHKIYVQSRMRENAAEIWKWLDGGAHFFVCGDAMRMAKDVDAALREIIQEQGRKSPEEASEFVEQLKADKRYKRDVY